MRVLLFIDGLDSGGAQRQMIGLASYLKSHGYGVKLISYKKEANFYEEKLISEHIDYKIAPCRSQWSGLYVLLKSICKLRPSVVISFLGRPNLYACLIRMFVKVPLIVSERNTTLHPGFFDKVRFRLYRQADVIIPNSHSQYQYLSQNYTKLGNKTFVITNFVDTDHFCPANRHQENRRKKIVVVARVVAQKNVLGFIDAIVELSSNRGYSFTIDWYGDLSDAKYVAECRTRLERYDAHECMTLRGENNDIKHVYQSADAFCLPSFYEGTPNVICEAMACGLPILCSDVCDNSLFVEDGKNGFLFNPRQKSSIVQCFSRLLDLTDSQLLQMGARSRDRVLGLCSYENFGTLWTEVVEKVTTKNSSRKIYFFAKVGNLNQKAYGGGEIGNRRTLKMMQELGYDVCLIPRYYNYEKKSAWVYLMMVLGDLYSVARLFGILMLMSRKNAVVHVTGYTGSYLPIEASALLVAKILGYKAAYEIRGGGIVEGYYGHHAIYRLLFKLAVSLSEAVFSQGMENQKLINSLCCTRFFYYPNSVADDFVPSTCPVKSTSIIKCIYLGRLAPMKNVDVTLKIIREVKSKGYDVVLQMIGDGADHPNYVKELKTFVNSNGMSDYCYFEGAKTREEVPNYLRDATFFLFPSSEKREGQSNSLTEAMSYGVIPISSSQGFSKSIIGCDELIVPDLNPASYSDRMVSIIEGRRIGELSLRMYQRIRDNFAYSQIKKNFENAYKISF